MRTAKRLLAAMVLAGIVAPALILAEEPDKKTELGDPVQSNASADDIARWVQQLDAPRFAERQEASRRLSAAGKAVIPALEKAAAGESVEAAARAIELLREMLDSPDSSTRDAAKQALTSISASDRPAAARRAQEALSAKETEERLPRFNPMFGGGAMQIVVGNAQRVSVKTINGVKEINADEGHRKIKIVDEPGKGIQVEITKKKDGKDVTERYSAANEEELKKKHPEEHKLYEQYGKNQGGIFRVQIAAGLQPAPAPRGQRLTSAAMMMRAWGLQLGQLVRDKEIQDAPPEAKEQLKKQVEETNRQLQELEKKLKGP